MEQEDTVERYLKEKRVYDLATKLGAIVAMIVNIWVALSLASDLMGIDFGKVVEEIAKYGWRLPPDWVVKWHPYLYAMQWILFVVVVIDTALATTIFSKEGVPEPPAQYLMVVSAIGVFCGLWLYLAYKMLIHGYIFFASFVTLMYVLFTKKPGEVGEIEEEFEPDIWKETA